MNNTPPELTKEAYRWVAKQSVTVGRFAMVVRGSGETALAAQSDLQRRIQDLKSESPFYRQ